MIIPTIQSMHLKSSNTNLDKLVNEGTSFTNAFNMGGWHGTVCVASRSMIISGRSWNTKRINDQWVKKKTWN